MIQCACSCATELSRMTTGNAAMRAVLEDLRVIDLRHDVAGPYGRQILGDMGTEVIKVERPGSGDDTRAWKRPALGRQVLDFFALSRNVIARELATLSIYFGTNPITTGARSYFFYSEQDRKPQNISSRSGK